jgi:CheY-specific phosphatase CheX
MLEHKPLYQAMKKAVSTTLENMVFLEALEHYDQEYEIPVEDLAWSTLLIQDPVQGEIRLAMTKDFLKRLTASVFALDEDEITQAQMDDALHELVNTIAGLFMTNLMADSQTFQLGLPEHGEGELPELEPGSVVWRLMTVDEDPLQVFATGVSLLALND